MSEQESTKIEAAEVAALEWLAVVDEGGYAESWKSAAGLLKSAVTEDQFVQSLEAALGSFGAMRSRQSAQSSFHTELPGAPDGEYVVIQFNTSFENKKTAVETVTPMLEADGAWRVSGYFVK